MLISNLPIQVLWILYGLVFVVALFVVILLVVVDHLRKRIREIEVSGMRTTPRMDGAPSVASITQSKVFSDTVNQMVHAYVERYKHDGKAEQPSAETDDGRTVEQEQPVTAKILSESERALLFDILDAAKFRVENSHAGNRGNGSGEVVCTLFLTEVNQQYQQHYTRSDCDALARKLVTLTHDASDPVLAGGNFMRIRYIRENVAIDFDGRAINSLKERFKS